MTQPSSQKLADALHAVGFLDLADRARADEFHEFFGVHALPLLVLHDELRKIIADDKYSERARGDAHRLRAQLVNGDFDATDEESEAWADSPEGQASFAELMKDEPK